MPKYFYRGQRPKYIIHFMRLAERRYSRLLRRVIKRCKCCVRRLPLVMVFQDEHSREGRRTWLRNISQVPSHFPFCACGRSFSPIRAFCLLSLGWPHHPFQCSAPGGDCRQAELVHKMKPICSPGLRGKENSRSLSINQIEAFQDWTWRERG